MFDRLGACGGHQGYKLDTKVAHDAIGEGD